MSQHQAGVKGGGGDLPADEDPTKSKTSLGDEIPLRLMIYMMSNLHTEEMGGGGDLKVDEASIQTKMSPEKPNIFMLGSPHEFEIMLLDNWVEKCELRSLTLQIIDEVLEDVLNTTTKPNQTLATTPPPPPPAVLEEALRASTTPNHILATATSPPPPPATTNHHQGVKKPQSKKSKEPLQHLLMPNIKNRKAVPNPEKTKF